MDLFSTAAMLNRRTKHHTSRGGLLSYLGVGKHHKTDEEKRRVALRKQMESESDSEESQKSKLQMSSAESEGEQDASSSDSGSEEVGEEEDLDGESGVLMLHSAAQMSEIFGKLIDFKLEKIFVDKVARPYNTILTSLVSSSRGKTDSNEAAKKLNPLDTYLEMNIKDLFNPNKFDVDDIKEAICAFVNNPDKKTFTKEESTKVKQDKRLLKTKEEAIRKFYPHLLNAMKALVVYLKNNSETKAKLLENEYDKRAYYAWKEVFGDLKSIQQVISYGIKSNMIKIDKLPPNFSVITTDMEEKLKNTKMALMVKRHEIQIVEEEILKRDNEIMKINAKYKGIENHKTNLEGKLLGLQMMIRQMEDPVEIAKENIAALNPQD
jgi:hypothetical protein